MTERGMRGCSVIVNRLIDNVFWLSCKDERKKRNDRLSEGDSIFPYIKNMPSFLKKMVMFLKNNSLLCVFGQVNPAPTNETTALSTF